MPKAIWGICVVLSVLLSAFTLLVGWMGGMLEQSLFWGLWGFVSAYPVAYACGLTLVSFIIDRRS